jgi:diadenosine tetraphosphatase ApaH/serine/threonine PP2A family protein phosphatase
LKYAIISDLHANLEAVEACFAEIENLNADRIICLGDLVDYCAQPIEVIQLVQKKCHAVVLGNHDEAQFNHPLSERFNERAKISSIHTRSVLNPEIINYFRSLPLAHSESDLLFVHASPVDPSAYKYMLDEEAAVLNFPSFTEKICFIGHSHRPLLFESSADGIKSAEEGKLDPAKRYIINVGSVGQPRDNNPKLSFGFLDTELWDYRNIRVEYDTRSASEKIAKEGLPEFLASRIIEGI